MDFQRVQHHSSSIQIPSSKIQVPFKFLSSSIQTRCVSVSPGPPRPIGPLRLALLRSVPRRRCAAAVSTAFASLCRRYGPAGARSGRGLCAALWPLTSHKRYAAHIRARLRPACRRRARGPPGRCAPPGGPPRLRWRAAFAALRAPPLRPVGARRGPSLGRLAARVALAVPPAAAGWLGPFLLPRRASRSGCAALRLRSSPSLRCAVAVGGVAALPLPAGRRAALLASPGAGGVLSSLGAAFRRALRRFAPCPRSSVARRCAAAVAAALCRAAPGDLWGLSCAATRAARAALRPSNRYKKNPGSLRPRIEQNLHIFCSISYTLAFSAGASLLASYQRFTALSRLNKIIVLVQSVQQRWSSVELRLPDQLLNDTSLLSGSVCDYCSHTLPFSRANRTRSKRLFSALPCTPLWQNSPA